MLLKEILTKHSNNSRTAVKCGNNSISYNQLFEKVLSTVTLIKGLPTLGSNIGIFLPNSIEYVIAFFTITFMDKIIIPIGIHSKYVEIKSTIEYCNLSMIITNNKHKTLVKQYLRNCTYRVTLYNIDDYTCEDVGEEKNAFEAIDEYNLMNCNSDSTALMLHTSGTTSNPKRVMLTHRNLISNVESIIKSLKLTSEDITLISLPLTMASAITSQMLTHLYLGATIVIMHDIFLPNTFFSIVEAAKITNFTGVPPMILLMFEHRKRIHHDMSSLRFIGCCGSKIDSKNAKDFILSFPCIGFIIMYGQTEASTRITHLLPEDSLRKLGSAGTPIPGVKVKIINKNGAPVAQGEVGEIIVQGNNVMKGYYKRIEETNRTLVENWLYTGDLAYYDEEGYIYIVGRKKNVIISGGINIYPEEIEEVLMFNPAVKEVCIEGKKHNILGEVPIAKIVLHKEHIGFISENDIINYCFENISKYKIPTEVHFVDELNKTENGKVKRKQREVLL